MKAQRSQKKKGLVWRFNLDFWLAAQDSRQDAAENLNGWRWTTWNHQIYRNHIRHTAT